MLTKEEKEAFEENKNRGDLNPNQWWEHFGENVSSFSYLFISSEFRGHYRDNIQYIKNRFYISL